MITGVLLPVLGLLLCAAVIPIGVERWMPETIAGMVATGVVSAVLMTLLSAGYFLWAYASQDTRLLDAIGIAPGESVALEPGGLHAMLTRLQEPMIEGESFPLTLTFSDGGEVVVEVPILGLGARGPEG